MTKTVLKRLRIFGSLVFWISPPKTNGNPKQDDQIAGWQFIIVALGKAASSELRPDTIIITQ